MGQAAVMEISAKTSTAVADRQTHIDSSLPLEVARCCYFDPSAFWSFGQCVIDATLLYKTSFPL